MKYKIVLVPFPFEDLSSQKVRPALCLTDAIKPYDHVVLSFITSNIPDDPNRSDLVIRSDDVDFETNGLKVSSTVRLHRLVTISTKIIKRELGVLTEKQQLEIEKRLRLLFEI